ncbi:MAG: TlpA family protein disulfide reductase [Candidatus Delongbacteria bacterium]|nr:TlpA family protein disulfide reductase [Candidatus Delongbacteria bacterium]
MKTHNLVLALLLGLITVTVTACGGKDTTQTTTPDPVVKEQIIDLKNFDLTSLDGKVRMFELWGVWCMPCIRSMPKVQELHEQYSPNADFELLVINTAWRGDNPIKVKEWLDKNPQYDFQVYYDGEHSLSTKYEVNSIPRTIIIGKDNQVRFNDHPMKITHEFLDQLLAE